MKSYRETIRSGAGADGERDRGLVVNMSPVVNGTIGSETDPTWLTLKVFSGGVTLKGNIALHGFVIAPTDTVTINGNSTLDGGIMADRLTINGNGLLNGVDP